MESGENAKAFLEGLLRAIVDYEDDVKVEKTIDEMGVLLTVDVNREDMRQVIGKSGSTANAIRTILRIVGRKENARVNMKINEPDGGA